MLVVDPSESCQYSASFFQIANPDSEPESANDPCTAS